MRTHEAIESEDYRRIDALSKDAEFLRPAIRNWYAGVPAGPAGSHEADPEIAGLEPLLLQAMRPFLSRCADAIMARTLFQGWPHGNCPLCGGGAGLLRDHPGRGAAAHLLPLHVALAVPSARLPAGA